jgi:hypothetical protein
VSGQGAGLRDPIYWRPFGRFHAFVRVKGEPGVKYASLCGRVAYGPRERIGGQATRRPSPELRCGLCDGLEMERRGWAESGPTTMVVLT